MLWTASRSRVILGYQVIRKGHVGLSSRSSSDGSSREKLATTSSSVFPSFPHRCYQPPCILLEILAKKVVRSQRLRETWNESISNLKSMLTQCVGWFTIQNTEPIRVKVVWVMVMCINCTNALIIINKGSQCLQNILFHKLSASSLTSGRPWLPTMS